MQLNENGLKNRDEWEKRGYETPKYNRLEMIKKTRHLAIVTETGAGKPFAGIELLGTAVFCEFEQGFITAEYDCLRNIS